MKDPTITITVQDALDIGHTTGIISKLLCPSFDIGLLKFQVRRPRWPRDMSRAREAVRLAADRVAEDIQRLLNQDDGGGVQEEMRRNLLLEMGFQADHTPKPKVAKPPPTECERTRVSKSAISVFEEEIKAIRMWRKTIRGFSAAELRDSPMKCAAILGNIAEEMEHTEASLREARRNVGRMARIAEKLDKG